MAEESELTELAIISWIKATATHDQDVGIEPRQYKTVKFDPDTLNPVTLPSVVVQARQDRQLNTNVAVWLYECEITLTMQADDTSQSAWNAASTALETIFRVQDLAGYLTAFGTGYLCRGVLSRNLGSTMIEDRHWKRKFGLMLWASRSE